MLPSLFKGNYKGLPGRQKKTAKPHSAHRLPRTHSHLLRGESWSSLVVGVEMKAVSSKQKAVVFVLTPKKIMQCTHGIIPQLFDCWADPVAHFLLLKNPLGEFEMKRPLTVC